MKKLIAFVMVAAMMLCCAVAEHPTQEVTIEASFEGKFAEVDQQFGLVVAVPSDWEEYELEAEDVENGYMFCYGTEEIQLYTSLVEGDLESFYAEYSSSEDYIGFVVASINGTTWLLFSSADDCGNFAVLNYADGILLCLEFYTAEPMGQSTLPVEILGTLTTKEALAA